MQRVRVGVTGLAAVMLIVAVATAIASGVRSGPDALAGTGNHASVNSSNAIEASSEPLAQLGVAPGATIDKQPVERAKQPR